MRCRVITPGKLGSRRHINLPGVDVNLPSLTEKDERDIRVGRDAGIDFLALSFVRRADDILVLRALLDHLGSKARIIAKIEDQGGLRNLPEHRQGRRRRHGRARRSGHRNRLSHAAAGADADRRAVPDRGQAGDHRHAPARIDDLRADADARGDFRHLQRRARARRRGDALRRNHHRPLSAGMRRGDEEHRQERSSRRKSAASTR